MDGKTDKKQECLTPIATEDDYPTPRFSANDSACESPGLSFGLHSVVDAKGITGKICHQDTCQYVNEYLNFVSFLALHLSGHGGKLWSPLPLGRLQVISARSE